MCAHRERHEAEEEGDGARRREGLVREEAVEDREGHDQLEVAKEDDPHELLVGQPVAVVPLGAQHWNQGAHRQTWHTAQQARRARHRVTYT